MRKILASALSFLLIFSTAVFLPACKAKASEGLEFKSNGDGTCAVVGIGTCEDENLVIPQKSPDGDKVTSIGDEAFKSSKIRSVSMPNTVTEIGISSFQSCHRLENIEFSNSLKKIGSYAFRGCDSITEITLPNSFEEFSRTIGTDGNPYEGSGAFQGCEKLSKINIPKKVKAIYENTFDGTALTEVKVDADFEYGHFDVLFMNKAEIYSPALYASDPDVDDEDIVKLTDEMKTVLYSELFQSKDLKINGKKINVPSPQATSGFYGVEDSKTAFKITENGKIEEYYYNTTYGKYELNTYYKDDSENVYSFEYDENYGAYKFTRQDGDTYNFVVYGDYLIISSYGAFRLNVECKE